MVKKVYRWMLLVVVGLMPTIAAADQCVRNWHSLSAEKIAGFQLWAESWDAYEPRQDRYHSLALAQAILVNHVRPKCAAQLQALGMDESQYLRHMIGQNFEASAGGIPEYIPQQAVIDRLAGPGLYLGLPQTRTQPTTRSAPAQTRSAPAPAPTRSAPAPTRRPPAEPTCSSCPRGGA